MRKIILKIQLILIICLSIFVKLNAQVIPVYIGDTSTLHVKVSGTNGAIQWQESTDSIAWINIENGTDSVCKVIVKESPSNKRYFRANVIIANCAASAWYGSIITHKIIPKTITDFEGNSYNTVIINYQVWMKENLKSIKYNDGIQIPLVLDNIAWGTITTPSRCFYNKDSITYYNVYGVLYNWYTIKTGKLCPAGWHIPTDNEWTVLNDFLGGYAIAGGKLKETGTIHWQATNPATNSSGFTALPGGYRGMDGLSMNLKTSGMFWSSIDSDSQYAFCRYVSSSVTNFTRSSYHKNLGLSVRCLMN